MTGSPFVQGATSLPDDVYDALVPLDGFPKGSRGGPRPYVYEDEDGLVWWAIIGLSDVGDLTVGVSGPINPERVRIPGPR